MNTPPLPLTSHTPPDQPTKVRTWHDVFDDVFGFTVITEDGSSYLDTNTSFFRLVYFERGLPLYALVILCGMIMQTVALIVEWCDSNTNDNWLLLGQNQVSLGVLLYLVITFVNLMVYPSLSPGILPMTVKIQWILHVILLPSTSVGAIAYWRLLRGSSYGSEVQASKATALSIMIFLGLFGMHDARRKHLLLTTAVLFLHIAYVITLAIFGNFVYSSVLDLNAVDLLTWGLEFTFYNLLIHSAYILIHRLKVHKRHNGSLWKTTNVGPIV